MMNVQSEIRAAERKLKLKEKLRSRIEEEGVELHEDDYNEIFEEADKDTTKLTKEHYQ